MHVSCIMGLIMHVSFIMSHIMHVSVCVNLYGRISATARQQIPLPTIPIKTHHCIRVPIPATTLLPLPITAALLLLFAAPLTRDSLRRH